MKNRKRSLPDVMATWPGAYYLAISMFILFGAMTNGINLMYLLAGIMLGLFILNAIIVLWNLRRVHALRRLPEMAFAGDSIEIDIELTNDQWNQARAVVFEDEVTRPGNAFTDTETRWRKIFLGDLPRGTTTARIDYGHFTQRGRYELSTMQFRSQFPFGLLFRRCRFVQVDHLLVRPRLGQLKIDQLEKLQSEPSGGSVQPNRRGATDGEFHGLRDWRPGDDRRWIHWRTTARLGKPMVRQHELQQDQCVIILLDLWPGEEPSPQVNHDIEMAVSIAATLVVEIGETVQGRLALGVAGEEIDLVSAIISTSLMRQATGLLATVQPARIDRLPLVASRVGRSAGSNVSTIVIGLRPLTPNGNDRPPLQSYRPDRQGSISNAEYIDAGSPRLGEIFQFNGSTAEEDSTTETNPPDLVD